MTTRLLPALHEGHAPIDLHGAFAEALDAFQNWVVGADEPLVEFDGRTVPISSVFGRMRTCTDILPWRIESDVMNLVGDHSKTNIDEAIDYAAAARILRALCVARLRATAA